jgi:hypothetical protein
MKTKMLLVLFALVSLAIAQTSAYTPREAAKHVGETATITGMVDGVHQSGKGNIFLNMGGKYPNQAFTAFIPHRAPRSFPILSSTKVERWPCLEKSRCTRADRKSSSTRLRRLSQNSSPHAPAQEKAPKRRAWLKQDEM